MAVLLGQLLIILVTVAGVCGGRLLASRLLGIRGVRASLTTAAESGRPKIAFARAFAAIASLYLLCVVLFAVGLGCGGTTVVDETSMRVKVAPDGPAAQAGVIDGDRVVAVNGEAVGDWDALKAAIGRHKGERIVLDVERAGAKRSIDVEVGSDGKIRVGPAVEHRSVGFGAAVGQAVTEPAMVAAMLLRGFVRMVRGRVELSGPIGVQNEIGRAGNEENTGTWVRLLAALASYQAVFVDLVLLVLATITSLSRKMVPSGGKSS